jgi:hypothetical protein
MNSNNRTALPWTPLSESKKTLFQRGKRCIPQKAQTINFIGSCSKRMKGLGFKVGFGFRVLHAQSNHQAESSFAQFGLQPWTHVPLSLWCPPP